jgi:hypothetical protein
MAAVRPFSDIEASLAKVTKWPAVRIHPFRQKAAVADSNAQLCETSTELVLSAIRRRSLRRVE